jgi:hypothetical protein
MHDHLARIIYDSNDPVLQDARDAADRLEFWRERYDTVVAREGAGAFGRMWVRVARSLYQPVPVGEIPSVLRIARAPEQIRLVRRSVAIFGLRIAIGLVVAVSIGAWVLNLQDLTTEGHAIVFDGFRGQEEYEKSGFHFARRKQWAGIRNALT